MTNRCYPAAASLCLLLCGCTQAPSPTKSFTALTEEFVYQTLAFAPATATTTGYHQHQGVSLDEALDDYSRSAMQREHEFFTSFRVRLDQAVDPSKLSREDRADYDIINDQVSLALLELDSIQSYRHNPTVYVELIGNAMFGPYSLEYAPKPKRYSQIIARLEKIPAFFAEAKLNLVDAPEVWNRVAREENEGNIALVDETLRAGCPPELKSKYEAAAAGALAALRGFNTWLKDDLSQRTSDWRLGKNLYDQKFRYALGTDMKPADLLAAAEQTVTSTRAKMTELAGAEGVKAALDRIAQHHATPETYFSDARRDLAEATDFVKSKHLLDMPEGGSLDVIPTPVFMRGVYSVGGFSPAPALEPKLGAFYWITPISPKWAKDRIESKLREYNYYGLKILTIHEAMPGHWVQAEFAAKVQPQSRQLLRNVYGNGPYVEGWAVWATDMLVNEGYLNHDKDFALTWYKQLLRAVSNTILDIRLQTMGMTEAQAMDLMVNQTYQEQEEATGKWQRAQLSSCQLPMYFLGYRGWSDAWMRAGGIGRTVFNDRALNEGAVRLPSLPGLLEQSK